MRSLLIAPVMAVSLALAMASCAAPAPTPPSGEATTGAFSKGACARMGGIGIQNWDNPAAGDQVASMALAKPLLAFEPRMPNGLGDPVKLLVTPPVTMATKAQRGLTMIFDQDPYGKFLFTQGLWQGPPDFARFVQDTASGNLGSGVVVGGDKLPCGPTSAATTIRGSLPALLLNKPDGSDNSILWVENNIRYDVIGPDVTRDQVLQIANNAWS